MTDKATRIEMETKWKGYGMSGVTAAQGLACASAMRRGGLLGVDEFVVSCKATKSPDRTCMPWRAADALVAANIDPYKLDYTASSCMRYIGVSLYREDSSKAIINPHLRDVYLRIRSRRPRVFTPVTDVLRAAVRALIRHQLPLSAEQLLPHVEEEMRELWIGFLVAQPIVRSVRALLAISLMGALIPSIILYGSFTLPLTASIAAQVVFPLTVQFFVVAVAIAFLVCLGQVAAHMAKCRGRMRSVIRTFPSATASIAILLAFLT